jgi:cyclophilin family peptidyl-prolyl cis-trans isomerase
MKPASLLLLLGAGLFAQAPQPPQAPAAAPRPDGLYAIFKTSMGNITIQLYEKVTPNTVRNFVGLAQGTKAWMDPKTKTLVKRPLYNNTIFHRVMLDQMIQGGDPTGKGDHDCGVKIRDEIVPTLNFDRPGRLAMANTGEKDSGGCQWFITQVTVPHRAGWDGAYTIFGQVIEGQDVVKAISRAPGRRLPEPEGGIRPNDPPKLVSVEIQRVGPAPAAPAAKKAAPAKKTPDPAKQ